MNVYKYSQEAIAKFIGRHKSTVSRELKRNEDRPGFYWDVSADKMAQARRKQVRTAKRFFHKPLKETVLNGLGKGYSPEIISERLKREFRSPKMRVSPETIYQWLYAEARQGGQYYKYWFIITRSVVNSGQARLECVLKSGYPLIKDQKL